MRICVRASASAHARLYVAYTTVPNLPIRFRLSARFTSLRLSDSTETVRRLESCFACDSTETQTQDSTILADLPACLSDGEFAIQSRWKQYQSDQQTVVHNIPRGRTDMEAKYSSQAAGWYDCRKSYQCVCTG